MWSVGPVFIFWSHNGAAAETSVSLLQRFTGRFFSFMPTGRTRYILAIAALLLALPVGGCATSVADLPVVGVPADAPARPKEVRAYPAVHDMPQDRPEAAMDTAERDRVASDLIAARNQQAAAAAAANAPNPAAK